MVSYAEAAAFAFEGFLDFECDPGPSLRPILRLNSTSKCIDAASPLSRPMKVNVLFCSEKRSDEISINTLLRIAADLNFRSSVPIDNQEKLERRFVHRKFISRILVCAWPVSRDIKTLDVWAPCSFNFHRACVENPLCGLRLAS